MGWCQTVHGDMFLGGERALQCVVMKWATNPSVAVTESINKTNQLIQLDSTRYSVVRYSNQPVLFPL